MILCEVDNAKIFDEFSPSVIFAVVIFTGNCSSCMDKNIEELERNF